MDATRASIQGAPPKRPILHAAIIAQYQRWTHCGITGFGIVEAFANALKFRDDAKQLYAAVKHIKSSHRLMSELAETAVKADAGGD